MNLVGVIRCHYCGTVGATGTDDNPIPPLPEGWREVRRGFAGKVVECLTCTENRQMQRWLNRKPRKRT